MERVVGIDAPTRQVGFDRGKTICTGCVPRDPTPVAIVR
jgi:hypothetical protein